MALEFRIHARCACSAAARNPGARPFATAAATRVYERARPFAIRHIALVLELHPERRAVSGVATIEAERVDGAAKELKLDAVGMEIVSVESTEGANGKARPTLPHSYDGNTLAVALGPKWKRGAIKITYRATPARGLYFLAPDEHVTDRPHQVWSQCQDEDARHWFPCADKPHVKMTFELTVSVPRGWGTLSNGALVSKEAPKKGKTWTYHWRMDDPLPSYLVTLVAGEFTELQGPSVGAVPLTYLVPKGREEDGERTFRRTPAMVKHFAELTGVPFPWNKYAQVVVNDFTFGGMENTTATTLYQHVLLDQRAVLDITSDDLIAHELAHQWFGDYVTCRDWSHGWLNEGFATFFEHVDREARGGRDEYDYGLREDLQAYVTEANTHYKRPIVCQDYEAPIELFDRHLYEKGGLVLHMLRTLLGDETFWKGVNTYLVRHQRSVVETRDLMRAFEDVSGRSLEQFFEQWIYRAGHPHLEVKVEHDAGVLLLHVKQTQRAERDAVPFAFPLVVDIVTSAGSKPRRETRLIDKADVTIAIPAAERPWFIVVDPELAVVAELRVEAPLDMLRRQIKEAPTARGRWLAASSLGKRADMASVAVLAAVLGDEKEFWGVRAQAAGALGEARTQDAFDALLPGKKAHHPKVRRAVVHALGQFRTMKAYEAVRPLALRDPSYLVEAEAATALGNTRERAAFDTLVDVLDRPSWADVIRRGALAGFAASRDERAIAHVLARTRYGVPTMGRRAAINALPKLAVDRKHREALEDLLDDGDMHVRFDVARALGELGDPKSRPALAARLDREDDGRVRRRLRESLGDLGKGGKEEQQRLRDEIDKLKIEQTEMRGVLSKIEAQLKPNKAKRKERP